MTRIEVELADARRKLSQARMRCAADKGVWGHCDVSLVDRFSDARRRVAYLEGLRHVT